MDGEHKRKSARQRSAAQANYRIVLVMKVNIIIIA